MLRHLARKDAVEIALECAELRPSVARTGVAELVDEAGVAVDRKQMAARLAPEHDRGDREVLAGRPCLHFLSPRYLPDRRSRLQPAGSNVGHAAIFTVAAGSCVRLRSTGVSKGGCNACDRAPER